MPRVRAARAAFVFLMLAACALPTPSSGTGRAALVVVHGDGSFEQACVRFEGETIRGDELLRRSGLAVAFDEGNPLGTLVCSVDGEGCAFPAEDCLCRCRGGGACSYWAYFNREANGDWTYAVQGARLRTLRDGDMDAWIWLDRSLPTDDIPLPPEHLTFDAVCPS